MSEPRSSRILDRIVRETGVPEIVQVLERLSGLGSERVVQHYGAERSG